MAGAAADRNLLLGIIALQMDFISREALIAAMHAWALSKKTPLSQILQDQGALSTARRSLLDALVEEHIRLHDGDPQKSLASVSSLGSVRQDLSRIADPDLQASLPHVAAARQDQDADPYRTVPQASVGDSTSTGSRFRILRPHAKGGLGQVSVALDQELDRPVALKEIQDRHADEPHSRARFMQEAEITGKLEHPGIIPVYGLGHDASGRPFYAMRFIQGDSLKEAVAAFHGDAGLKRDAGARGARLRELLRRFTDVCDAVAYAHSRGVLHRDLKPGNIMLGPYGETLLVDWGLAKAVGAPPAEPPPHEGSSLTRGPIRLSGLSGSRAETVAGSIIGTPAYASPEQVAGQLDLLGPASDVYGLGATLYALLTGRPPVDSSDLEEVLRRVQKGEIPPPRSIDSTIPRPLEAICLRAMALRPEARYPSARALAEDVTRWLDDAPVSAYPEPVTARAGRWMRRHRTLVAGILILLVTSAAALAAGLVLVNQERQQTAEQRNRAIQEQAIAVRERNKAEEQRLEAETARTDADREAARAEHERTVSEQQRLKAEAAQADADRAAARAEQQRLQAEAARADAYRAALASFHQAADSSLATARLLRYASNQPDPQRQALAQVRSAAQLRLQASETLRASGQVAGDTAREEQRRWDDRAETMRSEADHWFNDFELRRLREIMVPSVEGEFSLDAPALAVRDDGRLIALAKPSRYVGRMDLVVLDEEGSSLHRTTLTVPQPAGRTDSTTPFAAPSAARLRFVALDQVECVLPDSTYTWSLADGRVTRKEVKANLAADDGSLVAPLGGPQEAARPGGSERRSATPIEIANDSYILTALPEAVSLRSRKPGAVPRKVWQSLRSYGSQNEECKFLTFLPNPRAFIWITTSSGGSELFPPPPVPFGGVAASGSRLFLGDALTGQVREAVLESGPQSQVIITRAVRFSGGLATLDVTWTAQRKRLQRVVFWDAVLPIVPTRILASSGPVQTLALAADGRILTGGTDHVVRAWEGRQRLWSLGPPPEWSSYPAMRESAARKPFGTYGLYDFAARDSLDLVIQRLDPRPDGASRMRMEIFGAVDGRPVPVRPEAVGNAGDPLAITADFRYAVVVSEDLGEEWNLDLWSPRSNQFLRRLGRYPKRRLVPEGPQKPAESSPFFSPAQRWLFVPVPDVSGRGVEFWRLPEVMRVGTAPATPPKTEKDLSLDPEEAHVVRIGSQVFDLASCQKRCDLEPALPESGTHEMSEVIGDTTITDENMMISSNLRYAPNAIHAWDLTTGKKSVLGDTRWSGPGPAMLRFHPDGSRLLIHGFVFPDRPVVTRPTDRSLPGEIQVVPLPDPPSRTSATKVEATQGLEKRTYRVELWDVPQRRRLRQIDRSVTLQSGSIWWDDLQSPSIWWDSKSFYLSDGATDRRPEAGAGPDGLKSTELPLCFSWSDGRELPRPPEVPLAHLPTLQRSFAPGPDLGAPESGGALWRGRDGLLVQVGWDPDRKPLAESVQFSPGTWLDLLRSRRRSSRGSGYMHIDSQARLLILDYTSLTEGLRGQWPQTTDIWEIQSGRRVVSHPTSEIFMAADPTGAWLASIDKAWTVIKIYETATGRVAHRVKLEGLPGGVRGAYLWWSGLTRPLLRLHPRGDRLIVCHQGLMYLWDAAADRLLCRVDRPVHFTPVDCVAQSPVSHLVASGGTDGVVLLSDREQGRFLRDLVGHFGGILSLAFHPEGNRLASSAQDGTVILWDVGGKLLWKYPTGKPGESATSIVFDRTGSSLFVGTSAGRLHRLEVKTGQPLATCEPDTARLRLALSPGGKRLILAGARGRVQSWDPRRDRPERTWEVDHAVDSLAMIGEEVAAIGWSGNVIEFWNVVTGRRLMSHDLPSGPVFDMRFDERAGELLVANKSNEIVIIDLGAIDRQLSEWKLDFLRGIGSRNGQ
jgi:hypothetical protein